jgi:serine/threonine-protein kinase
MRQATWIVCGSLFVVLACSSGNTDGGSEGATGGAATTPSHSGGAGNPGDSDTLGGSGSIVERGGSRATSAGTDNQPSTVVAGGGMAESSTGGSTAVLGDNGGMSPSSRAGANATTRSRGGASQVSTGGTGAATTAGASAKGGATAGVGVGGRTSGTTSTGGTSTSTTVVAAAGTASATDACGQSAGQLFGKDHPWNQRIDATPLDSESAAIVSYLQQNHTASARFRVDGPSDEPDNLYGITVLAADAATPRQSFTPSDDFYSPDCDPAPVPIPPSGAIEGETSYACTNDGDCHLIVVDKAACRLYEMWRANRSSASAFDGGCGTVWDLRESYRPQLRGECCTSADAAGLPIAAHMFNADEIASGRIEHAIRFILPNNLMRKLIYVRPATHSTSATSGPAAAPPYGTRMRLKSSFDASKLKPAARVVATALKEYGMILSDGGNITFTASNDRFTTHKWRDVGFTASDLTSLKWTDFEVPELGTRYTFNDNCNCERTPITR